MDICCSICSEIYTIRDEVVHPPCGHLFHEKCLQNWFFRSKSCPQCRQPCTELYRIFFNSETNREFHLASECPAVELNIQNKNLKDELEFTTECLSELQAINLSLQDLPKNRQKFDANQVQEQLHLALNDLQKAQTEIAQLKMRTNLNSSSNSNNDFESLRMQLQMKKIEKQMIEEDLNKSRQEILQLRYEIENLKYRPQNEEDDRKKITNVLENSEGDFEEDGAKSFKMQFDELKKATIYNRNAQMDKDIDLMCEVLPRRLEFINLAPNNSDSRNSNINSRKNNTKNNSPKKKRNI